MSWSVSSGVVELAHLVPDAELAEQAFHAEGARLVGHDRHDALAEVLVAQQHAAGSATNAIVVEISRSSVLLRSRLERRQRRDLELRRRLAPALRQVAAELRAPRAAGTQLRRALLER